MSTRNTLAIVFGITVLALGMFSAACGGDDDDDDDRDQEEEEEEEDDEGGSPFDFADDEEEQEDPNGPSQSGEDKGEEPTPDPEKDDEQESQEEERPAPETPGPLTPEQQEEYEADLQLAIESVDEYWSITFPEVFGGEYQSPSVFGPYSSEEDGPTCFGEAATPVNAFYCFPPEDFIAWDEPNLFIPFFRDIGDFAIAFVIAHEWGHAIQARANLGFDALTILTELQADCFAGAWARWAQDEQEILEPGDLDEGVIALYTVRDPIDTPFTDPGAHGSAFERSNAFSDGFNDGPEACLVFTEGEDEQMMDDQPEEVPGGDGEGGPDEMPGGDDSGEGIALASDDIFNPGVLTEIPFQEAVNASTATSQAEEPQPTCGSGADSSSIWYSATPIGAFDILVGTAGSDYDTVVAVWEISADGTQLTEVACNDDVDLAGGDATSFASFSAVDGATYLIGIYAYSTGPVGTNLQVTITTGS
ncbi:MAG: hypothetical protein GEU28_09395 [Dehalococcoidia bacterium]|nr:hypothetical protein [Dehalococcoidia bacterium]